MRLGNLHEEQLPQSKKRKEAPKTEPNKKEKISKYSVLVSQESGER